MPAWYLVRRIWRNPGVVDVGWSLGVGLAAVALAVYAGGAWPRRLLVAGLVGFWSMRLGGYLLAARIFRGEQDARYQTLLARWGKNGERRLFALFLAQGFLIGLFTLPLIPALTAENGGVRWFDAAGAGLWLIALAGESLADRQLAAWRRDPENKGKVCTRGLWRYSRHPNYFFEWLHWWTYVLLGLGSSLWWLSFVGPVLMFLFLFQVTGIPYAEAQCLRSKGEAYRAYQARTPAFFPWFPRRPQ